ncbi:hypothetical protein PLESTM_001733300 [Pleodorina starrii]|nr:hypothetical protein PLESTM_001733300 [Pleodorina starrii]
MGGGGPGGGGAGFSSFRRPEDIFAEIFGRGGFGMDDDDMGGHPFGGMGGFPFGIGGMGGFPGMGGMGGMGGRRSSGPPKAKAIEHKLNLSLEDLYSGVSKKMKINRKVRGVLAEEIVEINVKPGWKKGTRITFQERGDEEPGIIPADIVFVVDEKPHPVFRREGADLHHTAVLSLADALCGTTLRISHLDGSTLELPVRDVIRPGETKLIRGKGMPITKEPGAFGNLVVRFDVRFPRDLSDATKQQLRGLLPSA